MGKRMRRTPRLSVVQEHLGIPPGRCYRCGVNARIERAHVIDFAFGGTDEVTNVVPLCHQCHRSQTALGMIFIPGEEDLAWAFMNFDPKKYADLRWAAVCHQYDYTDEQERLILASIEADVYARWIGEIECKEPKPWASEREKELAYSH